MSAADRNLRLGPHPGEIIDRSRTVSFEFEGGRIEAYEGDTVASALHTSGVKTLSRSFKYHRPRGLFCVSGRCPNCLVTVDGVPNVRACMQTVEAGMTVQRQNAWPNADRDLLSVLDRLGRFMPVGFYYKVFHRPKLLWQLAQPIIRRLAGLGVLDTESVPDRRHHQRYLHADVAVIGGGPAGLSAALASASAGADTVLVDDQPDLGGTLRYEARTGNENAEHESARQLVDRVRSSDIGVMSGSTAFGFYQDNLIAIMTDDEVVKLRTRRVVMATGCYEVPLVFDNNDLPGVMLSSGARRLMRLYGVRPGRIAVVATTNDQGYDTALDLLESDVRVAAVVDVRPDLRHGADSAEALRSQGVPILNGHVVARAIGHTSVVAAEVTGLADGGRRRFDCDLICTSGGSDQSDSLLAQAGGLRYDADLGEQVPRDLPANVYVAGDITGIHDLQTSIVQGQLAGVEAAASLGNRGPDPDLEAESLRRGLSIEESRHRSNRRNGTATDTTPGAKRRFVCLCEDVTDKDIMQAIDEGFDDIQTLKRYSAVSMGPCQGKMCHKSLVDICASHTGRGIAETGATTARPPLHTVSLGALAGPSHRPIRLTPMHDSNVELGASMADLGNWRRPHNYGSPEQEYLAVRERVGVIDVSSLGKLRVEGRDAGALLDKVYTGRISNLRVGRVRYGLMCADNGAILDDGTVTRLADDDYFVTTTSGNAELIDEWLRWWIAGTGLCAHVTNVSSAFGAVNVAGPRARDTLGGITEVDLSPGAFRYMRSARGTVGGVPSILLRIGFVGETGWEVHFPAEYGEHMWDAIMGAGERFGIAPFGLEAQRILRLEKGHIIVGQDTDSATSPLEAGMGWAVASDKGDFIGKSGIQVAEQYGIRSRIVGFVVRDGRTAEDGDPVVAGGSPVGRVTSARMSPAKGTGIGLAWVPIGLAEEGREIVIRVGDIDLPAQVTLRPVYDPDGARLRD